MTFLGSISSKTLDFVAGRVILANSLVTSLLRVVLSKAPYNKSEKVPRKERGKRTTESDVGKR